MKRCRSYYLALALAIFSSGGEAAQHRKAHSSRTQSAPVRPASTVPVAPRILAPSLPLPPLPHYATPPRIIGDASIWFGASAYPPQAIRDGSEGRVVFKVAVDTQGYPIGCIVESSSGAVSLDDATCQIAGVHLRFAPARNEAGLLIPSYYRMAVRWVFPEEPATPQDGGRG